MDYEFSAIGLGCWGLSGQSVWENSNDADSVRVVHEALEAGINFFDVAPVYGMGHAEEILGKALTGYDRDKIIVASKCGLVWDDKNNISNNLSKDSILTEIDESLKRLQLDYIDIYQLHWPDPNTDLEETVEAIQSLKSSGKIKHLGVTNFSMDDVKRIMSMEEVASQQGLYNMMERNATSYHNIPLEYRAEDEMIPMCKANGQAFFPYSPLFQGLLTGTFQDKDNFSENDIRSSNPKLNGEAFKVYYDAVQKLNAIARRIGRPLNELALNWLLYEEGVTSIISGATNPSHIRANVSAMTWELDDVTKAEVDTIVDPFK